VYFSSKWFKTHSTCSGLIWFLIKIRYAINDLAKFQLPE
jgi:hypothetical protein